MSVTQESPQNHIAHGAGFNFYLFRFAQSFNNPPPNFNAGMNGCGLELGSLDVNRDGNG